MGAQGASNQTGLSSPVKTVSAVKNNNGKAEVEVGGGGKGVNDAAGPTIVVSQGGGSDATLTGQGGGPVRQIVMPSGLAAQLAASGRQIVVVTGPGGQKMVALKPITPQSTPPTPQTGLSRGQPVSTAITLKPGESITQEEFEFSAFFYHGFFIPGF